MNAQDCLKMLREMRDVAFSTVDAQGFPRARIIDVMIVEETDRKRKYRRHRTEQGMANGSPDWESGASDGREALD